MDLQSFVPLGIWGRLDFENTVITRDMERNDHYLRHPFLARQGLDWFQTSLALALKHPAKIVSYVLSDLLVFARCITVA
jgi:hypothetical protein